MYGHDGAGPAPSLHIGTTVPMIAYIIGYCIFMLVAKMVLCLANGDFCDHVGIHWDHE